MKPSAFMPAFGNSPNDRYAKKEKVGGGAYGEVYKGVDTRNGDLIAIKKIKLDVATEGIPSTAMREIVLLKRLAGHKDAHPNIVKHFL